MATQVEVATIAQLAATLLAAPPDSAAAMATGVTNFDEAIGVAIKLYDAVGHARDSARSSGR